MPARFRPCGGVDEEGEPGVVGDIVEPINRMVSLALIEVQMGDE